MQAIIRRFDRAPLEGRLLRPIRSAAKRGRADLTPDGQAPQHARRPCGAARTPRTAPRAPSPPTRQGTVALSVRSREYLRSLTLVPDSVRFGLAQGGAPAGVAAGAGVIVGVEREAGQAGTLLAGLGKNSEPRRCSGPAWTPSRSTPTITPRPASGGAPPCAMSERTESGQEEGSRYSRARGREGLHNLASSVARRSGTWGVLAARTGRRRAGRWPWGGRSAATRAWRPEAGLAPAAGLHGARSNRRMMAASPPGWSVDEARPLDSFQDCG